MLKKYERVMDIMDSIVRKVGMPSGMIAFAHMPIIMAMKSKGISEIIIDNMLKSICFFFGVMMIVLLIMLIISIPYVIILGFVNSRKLIERKFTDNGRLNEKIEKKKEELLNIQVIITRIEDENKRLESLRAKEETCKEDIIKLEKEYNGEVV